MMGCIFAANCAFFSFNHHKLITRTNPALKLAPCLLLCGVYGGLNVVVAMAGVWTEHVVPGTESKYYFNMKLGRASWYPNGVEPQVPSTGGVENTVAPPQGAPGVSAAAAHVTSAPIVAAVDAAPNQACGMAVYWGLQRSSQRLRGTVCPISVSLSRLCSSRTTAPSLHRCVACSALD